MSDSTVTVEKGPAEEVDASALCGSDNPYNWNHKTKWLISATYCIQNLAVSMGSSIFTPGIGVIAYEFKQSTYIATLGLSLYVIGFALGPMIFAPMSEVYGRRAVQVPAWILFCLFQIGCALAQNIETLVICRFFVGVFGSPSLTVAGGVQSDFWKANDVGPPLGFFTMSAFLGPVVGPIIGGFLVQKLPTDQGWRWCFWVQFIFSAVLGLNWLWLPETLHKTLVNRKAKQNQADLRISSTPITAHQDVFWIAVRRPLQMLFLDPVVFLASLYVSFIFGILYLFFAAYPIVFQGRYGMDPGPSGLAFLGIGFGVILSLPAAGYSSKLYVQLKTKRGLDVFPEGRLPPAIVGSFLLPISLFWFAWSGFRRIHWIVPILSGIPFGWSMTTIFISFVSFVAEGYLEYSASAIAANTLLRSFFAAAFPLFSNQMYEKLKPEWASSLLAFASLLFIPVPYLFWRYGPTMRAWSKFRPEATGSGNQ